MKKKIIVFFSTLLVTILLTNCSMDILGQSTERTKSDSKQLKNDSSPKRSQSSISTAVNFNYNDWNSGFSMEITITNTGTSTINDWVLEFDWPWNMTSFWDSKLVSHSGNHYKVTNVGWNSSIAPGQTRRFGGGGSPGGITSDPANVMVNGENSNGNGEIKNMVANGDFSAGTNNWRFGTYGGGVGTGNVVNGEYVITISNPGTVDHGLQLEYTKALNVVQGNTYVFSFDARCTEGSRPINKVVVEKVLDPWTSYSGIYQPDLTTTMTRYSYEFTMTEATDAGARITFNCGNAGTKGVIIDNISLMLTGAPAIPQNLHVASKTENSVKLAWNSVGNAEKYILRRDNSIVYQGPNTLYTDTGLTTNQTYTYTIEAENSYGSSGLSDQLSVTLSPFVIPAHALFDDFNYTDYNDPDISAHGWKIKDYIDGPGPLGSQSKWLKENVNFINDPSNPGNRHCILYSKTSGTGESTYQAEIYSQRKYFEGTFAARVKFTDAPTFGSVDGDHSVQTFFSIVPLKFDMDPDYCEIDFEYLPNGGWGEPSNVFYMTTWETYKPDPWTAVKDHTLIRDSFAGWHTLIFQVYNGEVKYYIDGKLSATHGGIYYPEQEMSINFNLWYIQGGLVNNSSERTYTQEIDWVYYAQDKVVSPAEVNQIIANYRDNNIQYTDTVQ